MRHTLNINGQIIQAETGETLVDAALGEGVLIPHDCATGQCETCRVTLASGQVDDRETAYGDTVLACRSRVMANATLTFEEAPAPVSQACTVTALTVLSDSVLEMRVRTEEPIRHRPGQYAKLALRGFPAREYSYSAPLLDDQRDDQAVFQIKQLKNGRVSSALGNAIRVGHKGKMIGPFGSAFLRNHEEGALVLASSGTGFAPIWSIARAVIKAQPKRPVALRTGVARGDAYMKPAFDHLADHGINNIIVTDRSGNAGFQQGTPDTYLPELDADSSVHVAGNPKLVDAVRSIGLEAKAKVYADPFTASHNRLGLLSRLSALTGRT
ncbi:MAG: 2Fe-2S iron-sulfur cluster binding domain-containing protein [Pseudomonadota bacterium]